MCAGMQWMNIYTKLNICMHDLPRLNDRWATETQMKNKYFRNMLMVRETEPIPERPSAYSAQPVQKISPQNYSNENSF